MSYRALIGKRHGRRQPRFRNVKLRRYTGNRTGDRAESHVPNTVKRRPLLLAWPGQVAIGDMDGSSMGNFADGHPSISIFAVGHYSNSLLLVDTL
jgi:hypothetical protein